jgi:cytochrome c
MESFMDSFELNKFGGALLASVLVILGIHNLGNVIYANHAPEKPAYWVEVEEEAGGASAVIEVAELDVSALLAGGDAGKGAKVFKKCAACHTSNDGGANKVGPNLYNIVGREKASAAGFGYSNTLKDLGGTWGYDDLRLFLENPKKFAKGTNMAFGGLKKTSQQADLIAFLRAQSASPIPLP